MNVQLRVVVERMIASTIVAVYYALFLYFCVDPNSILLRLNLPGLAWTMRILVPLVAILTFGSLWLRVTYQAASRVSYRPKLVVLQRFSQLLFGKKQLPLQVMALVASIIAITRFPGASVESLLLAELAVLLGQMLSEIGVHCRGVPTKEDAAEGKRSKASVHANAVGISKSRPEGNALSPDGPQGQAGSELPPPPDRYRFCRVVAACSGVLVGSILGLWFGVALGGLAAILPVSFAGAVAGLALGSAWGRILARHIDSLRGCLQKEC